MVELSSPLQIAGLIETNCASDTGIYSIWRFTGNDYGTEYIGFAIFYSVQNDMDSEWLKNVKLLWEGGKITTHGTQFLEENWDIDREGRVYRNNKNQTIKFGYGPFGKNGEKVEIIGTPERDVQEAGLIRKIDQHSDDANDLNMLEEMICDRIQSKDTLYELAMEKGIHPHAVTLILPKIEDKEQLVNLLMNKAIDPNIRTTILDRIFDIDQLMKVAKTNREMKKYIKPRIKKLKKRGKS